MAHSLKDLAFTTLINLRPIRVTSIKFQDEEHINCSVFNVNLPQGEKVYQVPTTDGSGYICLRCQHIVPLEIRRWNKHECEKIRLGKLRMDPTKGNHSEQIPSLQAKTLTTIIRASHEPLRCTAMHFINAKGLTTKKSGHRTTKWKHGK